MFSAKKVISEHSEDEEPLIKVVVPVPKPEKVTLAKSNKNTEKILSDNGMMTPEKIEMNFYDNIQITNDIYNRCQFMELSTFFFMFTGLGMAVIEYELRHFFTYGEFHEGIDPSLVPPPLGMTPEKN